MNCDWRDKLLANKQPLATIDRALPEHLDHCADCRRDLQRMTGAVEVLRQYRPDVPAHASVRVAHALASSDRPPRSIPWLQMVFAACTGMALVTLAVALPGIRVAQQSPAATIESQVDSKRSPVLVPQKQRRLKVQTGQHFAVNRSKVTAMAGGAVWLTEESAIQSVLYIEKGRFLFEVEPRTTGEAAFVVTTAESRTKVVGTVFTVQAEPGGTQVSVIEGSVWVFQQGSPKSVHLRAGQSAWVEAFPWFTQSSRPQQQSMPRDSAKNSGIKPRRAAAEHAPLFEETAQPQPAVSAEELMAKADTLRRGGHDLQAAEIYQRVENDLSTKAYAEEALLQRSLLLAHQLNQAQVAVVALERGHKRFKEGMLRPERTALLVELYLDLEQRESAVAALINTGDVISRPLLRLRLRAARMLDKQSHKSRKDLLAPLLALPPTDILCQEAERLMQANP